MHAGGLKTNTESNLLVNWGCDSLPNDISAWYTG